jgi:hypothetical protein
VTVVQYEEPTPLPPSRPGDEREPGPSGDVARLRAAAEYANYIGNTDFVPETLRGNPAAIAAALLAGEELGLKKMAALRSIAIIRGRPTLTAEAQRGLIVAAGHEIWFEETTATRAIVAGRRAGSDRIGRITWTMDDAVRAGIVGQPNYSRYPAEMLRARASAALVRAMFPDVTLGIPASEELEDGHNTTVAAPADSPAPKPGKARSRRTGQAAPLAPIPAPDLQPEPPVPPEPLATDAQKRQMFALMRDASLRTATRDDRLDYTRAVIGRDISSSNELTVAEASTVIGELQKVLAGEPDSSTEDSDSNELQDSDSNKATTGLESAVEEEPDAAPF